MTDLPAPSDSDAGGDGEGLHIRGSARRLLRRVLEGKLKTATAGEYDRAREDLVAYAGDQKTSPSEKRKALQALLADESAGVVAAKAVLSEGAGQINIDARSVVVTPEALQAMERLRLAPGGPEAIEARLRQVMGEGPEKPA